MCQRLATSPCLYTQEVLFFSARCLARYLHLPFSNLSHSSFTQTFHQNIHSILDSCILYLRKKQILYSQAKTVRSILTRSCQKCNRLLVNLMKNSKARKIWELVEISWIIANIPRRQDPQIPFQDLSLGIGQSLLRVETPAYKITS